MTDHAPLTDEELAAIEIGWRALATPPPTLRLLAELRASRAEVKRLMEHCINCEPWLWQNQPFKGQA